MFKRLNTGGELLTQQQLRNCTIRLLNPVFNDFIIRLSHNEAFLKCTEILTDDQKLAAFDQELVLRFFAIKNKREEFSHDVADFLTEYMELASDPQSSYTFNYEEEERSFVKTFEVYAKTLAEKSFGYANKNRDKITKGFGVYHYEAFTVGLQPHLSKINLEDGSLMASLKSLFESIKFDADFYSITTGGGKNSKGPLNARINFVSNKLDEFLN
jgi:hypothetical protein